MFHAGANRAAPFLGQPGKRTGHALYRIITLATLFMMVCGGFAFLPGSASAQSTSQVLDDLNLRAEPAPNATISNVMPTGSSVEILGGPENGYYLVSYQGQTGYAYSPYLTIGGFEDGPVTPFGDQSEVYVAAGPTNFMTGPSDADGVISEIPNGALVALTGDSANGYLGIIYTDRHGWALESAILGTGPAPAPEPPSEPAVPAEPETPAEPDIPDAPDAPAVPEGVPVGGDVTGNAIVIDGALNLRLGPSTDYPVITVMPDAAALELRGEPMDGFFPVAYAGLLGWAFGDFLQIGGDEPEEPATPEEPAEPEPTTPAEEPEDEEPAEPEPTTPAEEEPTPAPTEEPEDPEPAEKPSEEEIIAIIYAAADRYDQPREDMLRVARCESVLDPSAVNSRSRASGLFQFLPSTWATTPFAHEDIFDAEANANAAAWMWSVGRRNEWTCQ